MLLKLKTIIRRFERLLLTLAASAALTALLMNLDFNLLEANLYDLRMAKGTQAPADPGIVLVTLDDKTTKALDEFAPLPLDYHARFMEALEKYEPKAVGYLIDLNQVNQVNPDLFQSDWGTRFVQAATRMENHGTVVMLGTPFDVTGEVLPPYPLSSLPHAIAVIHKDGNVFAEDKVTRRALTYVNQKPVFHIDLAQRLGFISYGQEPRGSFTVPEVDSKYFFFRYHGNTAWQTHKFHGTYGRISFVDLLQGNVDPDKIRGKILLIGTISKENSTDFAYTPYSKASFSNPKLSIHANILDSIIQDDGLSRAPMWGNWAGTFIATAIVFWFVLNSTPLYGVFATLGLAGVFILVTQFLFQSRGIWLRESQPLVGIFVGYYIVVPYRLIREYKKRWDYQRKNELLTQVEELKSNFLNLVTHDLKTPVARIQGLAEVVLRRSQLKPDDREQLDHIIASTDELNRFITSILELSKVESNHIQIQFEGKDINPLIEKAISTLETQIRYKRIKITTKLEPLFPIKVDAGLISKVLVNVIDNAVKYSPSGSEVEIESRESQGYVEISVRDHGIGLTEEERENLFIRFYRAKNNETAKTSGTGLGLYLTKYFVEAHFGRVEVESKKDNGSVFKIFLPLELPERDLTPQPGLTKRLKAAMKVKESSHV
jgi:signal transduction histidine kinase